MGDFATPFTRLREAIQQLQRLGKELLSMCPSPLVTPPLISDPVATSPIDTVQPLAPTPNPPNSLQGRDDAYRQLALLADYLARIEPHSPVPYLIRKAVDWGHKPLDEVLAEHNQDDPNAKRLWTLMGILRA